MRRFLAIALLISAVGCSGARSNMPSVDGSTGFHVVVKIGPTCPVETPGKACEDKPYETDLLVRSRSTGKVLGPIRTDAAGQTGLTGMEPGGYTLLPAAAGGVPPTATPVDFTVRKGQITEVTMTFDSGIR